MISDTPDGDANALGSVEAGAHNSDVVIGRCLSNIELSDGNLTDVSSCQRVQGSLGGAAHSRAQVHLSADTLDKAGVGRVDSVDESNNTSHLGVGGIEVIVIDVTPEVTVRPVGPKWQRKTRTWRWDQHRAQP